MTGSYDYRLVSLSVLIAICAAYTALDLAGRTTATRGRVRVAWLTGGAIAMGVGIWSMHYVGMLAFSLPVPCRVVFGIADAVTVFGKSPDKTTGIILLQAFLEWLVNLRYVLLYLFSGEGCVLR